MPFIQEMVRVDLRIQVIEIPSQDVISHDNVSMKVDAVLYFNVVNPERATIQVQHYLPATNMLAQTTLRAVLGRHELDEMLSEHVTTPRIALVPLEGEHGPRTRRKRALLVKFRER
jgi:regulator of protease activity HflC (stomatin/prohibitin superfamily)